MGALEFKPTIKGAPSEECRLHEEGGRVRFMTKRFDRTDKGEKQHMQSLGAMRHIDYNQAGAYAYEQAIETIQFLSLPTEDYITGRFG